jgi:hypothetical protein
MTLLKKINPDWAPQEHPGILVGDIVDFPGNVNQLIRERSAVLVDESGNELPAPGTVFTCAICYVGTSSLPEYTAHVLGHAPKPVATVEAPTPEVKAEVDQIKEEQKKNDFGAKMAAARAAAKAKREAEAAEAQAV